MADERRVVVTGVGPIASAGIGKESFWRGILEKDIGLRLKKFVFDGELWDKFYIHERDDFDISQFHIDKSIIEDIRKWKNGKDDLDLFYLLAAVKLALDDSRISYNNEDNNVGLYLSIEHPGFENFCDELLQETISYIKKSPLDNKFQRSQIYKNIFPRVAQSGYDLQSFMYLYYVAKAYGIHGYSLFTNNACASSLFAFEAAARQIKYGGSDITVLAAGDNSGTPFKHYWFKEKGIYAEDGKMKPFSKDADGLVLGDGVSAFVLEDLDHALRRKAHIYAEYLGGGFALEGWKVTIPQIGSSSYQKSIVNALNKAQLKPEDIDLINPHGVALKVTDSYEAKAITDIFGKNFIKPFITALKPYIGHNLGGSAILESTILLLSMEKNVIPPTLNCSNIEEKYNIKLVDQKTEYDLNTVMKLSCGFAGYNAAVIFKKFKCK